jgi:serine phosphatase RsbU (regulator of sigma subunit)
VGLPLGIDPGEAYQTVCWELAPGERLVLFTDGLVKTRYPDGEAFGRRRLTAELAGLARLPLGAMVRELVARAAQYRGGYDFEDDFTIVGVERWAD